MIFLESLPGRRDKPIWNKVRVLRSVKERSSLNIVPPTSVDANAVNSVPVAVNKTLVFLTNLPESVGAVSLLVVQQKPVLLPQRFLPAADKFSELVVFGSKCLPAGVPFSLPRALRQFFIFLVQFCIFEVKNSFSIRL